MCVSYFLNSKFISCLSVLLFQHFYSRALETFVMFWHTGSTITLYETPIHDFQRNCVATTYPRVSWRK